MSYKCSICGAKGVKLWRPHTIFQPLICADCAEKFQFPRKAIKIKWSRKQKSSVYSEGKILKKTTDMEEWSVDENGLIPSIWGKDPNGNPVAMTDRLLVDLSPYHFTMGTIVLIPAIPDKNGIYLNYDEIYNTGAIDMWKKFPTR